MKIILLSAPGAGKGTQAAMITARSGVGHISSGDVLRAEITSGSELGKQIREYTSRGDLVPDELLLAMMEPIVLEVAERTGGYILDGFPRTVAQARLLADIGVRTGLTAEVVIFLRVPEDVLIARLTNRGAIENRADDTIDVITRRLAVYDSLTRPVIDYYRGRGILEEVDGNRPVADVTARISDILAARCPQQLNQ